MKPPFGIEHYPSKRMQLVDKVLIVVGLVGVVVALVFNNWSPL